MKAPDKIYMTPSYREPDNVLLASFSKSHLDCHRDIEYVRKDSLWKPTPEQLEAMECAIIDYEEDGCNTIAGYLKEIYSQIKKL